MKKVKWFFSKRQSRPLDSPMLVALEEEFASHPDNASWGVKLWYLKQALHCLWKAVAFFPKLLWEGVCMFPD